MIAEHGAIGLELLKQKSAEIDAVILDYSMPVLSGREFGENSGNGDQDQSHPVQWVSGQHVLQALQFTNLKGFLKNLTIHMNCWKRYDILMMFLTAVWQVRLRIYR